MNLTLRVSSTARLEMQQAYNYYEDIQNGLGERFLKELEERYESIRKHPDYYSFVGDSKTVRDVALSRFPFTIVFVVRNDVVFVLSVFNTYRAPKALE